MVALQLRAIDRCLLSVRYLQGLGDLTYEIVKVASTCSSSWSLDAPEIQENVDAGSTVSFDYTLCTTSDTTDSCAVAVVADDVEVEDRNYVVDSSSMEIVSVT